MRFGAPGRTRTRAQGSVHARQESGVTPCKASKWGAGVCIMRCRTSVTSVQQHSAARVRVCVWTRARWVSAAVCRSMWCGLMSAVEETARTLEMER